MLKNCSGSKALAVSTEKSEKRNIIESVSANGKIQPEVEVKISSDVSGEIVELLVKEGDTVTKGQIIAFSGSTGHSTGPHLHFEVRYQSVILNPEHYFPNESDKLAVLKEVDL